MTTSELRYSTAQVAFHWLTVVLVVVMVGTGVAYSADIGDTVSIRVHQIAGQIFLLVLIGLHLAGVLKHVVHDRDNTLSRMTPRSRKETDHA